MGNTYKPTIGLEVHIQLATESKIFCSDKNEYGSDPNTNISVISLAHPGTLPKLNRKAIEYATRMGLACNSEISQQMYFDRKNYFYPDSPKGYQLTQDKTPICVGGEVSIIDHEGNDKSIVLNRIHLEEDAGKLIHNPREGTSNVDFNRSGVPLIELVTEPVITEPEDAARLMTEIRKIVRYLEISTGDMEKGSLRCDANVSIALEGSAELGKKVEVKNMNSFKHVKQAIIFEIERQTRLLENGGAVTSETRLYDVDSGKTFDMRTKEELNDYRYFPEPDLCPFEISDEWLRQIKSTMPMLPNQFIKKFKDEYGIKRPDALILTDSKEMAMYFNDLCGLVDDYKAAANWLIGPIKSYLNGKGKSIREMTLSAHQLSELINLVVGNKVSFSKASSDVLPLLFKDVSSGAEKIATDLGLIINSNEEDLSPIVEAILKKYPDKVLAYKNGKKGLLGLFMGELMKETSGKIDPKKANMMLVSALKSETS